MTEAVLRQWELLKAIPRAPAKADVAALHARLQEAGYAVSRRQVQRDLNDLSIVFDIQCDERGVAHGWSWSKNAGLLDLPTMDGSTALVLKLVEQFLPDLLPPMLAEYLKPYYRRAEETLKRGPSAMLKKWSENVRVVRRDLPLRPPVSDSKAMAVVYQALLEGRKIAARYRARGMGQGEEKELEINPLGLVVRGPVVYLVATCWKYTDIRQFALHRLRAARMLEEPANRVKGFDLDEYIAQGEFQYPTGPAIRLTALFERGAALHLAETPLSEDQEIEEVDEARVRVRATVSDSQQLEWWLLGFGEGVEVEGPAELRGRTVKRVREMVKRYRSTGQNA